MMKSSNSTLLLIAALLASGSFFQTPLAYVTFTTATTNRCKRNMKLKSRTEYDGCGDFMEREALPIVPISSTSHIIDRRSVLKYGLSAATLGSILIQATAPAHAATFMSPTSASSWMAPVQVKQLGTALEQLKKEAHEVSSRVTKQIQDDYNQNGVVVVRNVVSRSWINTLRRGCELAQDDSGPFGEYLQKPTDQGIFFTDLELARRLPLFSAFCQYGPCGAVAGAVMGSSSIRYLYDQLFVKEYGVSTPTPWHQDGGYWRVTGSQIGSVFVPLDHVGANDGLAFVKGSHRWELHNPQHFADGTPYVGTSLPPMPDISAMVDAKQVELLTFDLEPGDVLVFSARTTHGGPGNWGRALSTRWTGDDATFWARPGEGAVPTGNVHLHDGELLAHNAAAFPQVWSDTFGMVATA